MFRVIAASATAVLAAALATVPASAAAAAPVCAAYTTLPAKVSIDSDGVIVGATLRGGGKCHDYDFNSAGAALVGPAGNTVDHLTWLYFGQTDHTEFYGPPAGAYRLTDTSIHLADRNYREVPATLAPATMQVKYAGRFDGFAATRSGRHVTLTADTLRFRPSLGFGAYGPVSVGIQRSQPGRDDWYTIAHTTASSTGRVAWRYADVHRYDYRLYFVHTSQVWGAYSWTHAA